MNQMTKVQLRLFVLLAISVQVVAGGFFFVIPKNTSVIAGNQVFLECGTCNNEYTLTFEYFVPRPGYPVISEISSVDLQGGGRKINTTFIVTKELNATIVRCLAIGTTFEQTHPVVIYSYELPDGPKNNRVCQLADWTFVTWDPAIYALEGIKLTYNITDNMGSNHVTSDLHHSFFYTKKNYFAYNANLTVIVNATAANQIGYSIPTIISRILNRTIPLTVEYSCHNDGGNWKFDFHTKLDHLNINDCSINNETLKDAMIISCNEEQCINNSGSVNITKNEINSTIVLPAKRNYNHILYFNYLGRQIISQPLKTSTHDVQDIEYLSQNDTSLCLRFHLIDHYKIESIHMHVERGSELIPFNVMVPYNNNTFEWCASTIPPTLSSSNGEWSLFACDGPGYICTNPAFVLENIILNITETINVATTQKTITTMYTTHTATIANSFSITFSLSPSPNPTVAMAPTHPSSTVNLMLLTIVAVFFVIVIIAIIIATVISSKKF